MYIKKYLIHFVQHVAIFISCLFREPQWSSDEKLCGMLIGANVVLYEDVNFKKIAHRINIAKVANFSISPNNTPYYILCYMPGNYILLHLILNLTNICILCQGTYMWRVYHFCKKNYLKTK